VADFGIALAVNQSSGNRLTETGLSIGTPEYMSPEQAGGDRQLDARSDVYSLGAVLYEMLAGEPPHTGPTARAVVAKILSEPPTPLQVVRGGLPAGVETALARALAKAPADRFASAAEFASALSGKGGRVAARLGWSPSRRALIALLLVGAASASGPGIPGGPPPPAGDHDGLTAPVPDLRRRDDPNKRHQCRCDQHHG
jgi:serine/threonine-protein kinase